MMSRRYYDDSYTTQFEAQVIETLFIEGQPALILDQTYFYPTGGGQPHDTGTLSGADVPFTVQVVDVVSRAEDKAVVHVLSGGLELGARVVGQLDWARRFDLMQQHTGQHILSQAFIQVCDAGTVGFHLGADEVTIDLALAELRPEVLAEVERLANRILFENRAVTTRLISPAEAEGIRMRRVPEALATDGLRIVDIHAFDVTACGGTHVRSTGEVGLIKVLATERYKGGTRVTFVCGGRALRAFQTRTEIVQRLTAALTCALSDLPDAVGRLRENAAAADKTIKALREQVIDYEAVALIAQAQPVGAGRLVLAVYEGREAGDLRLMAGRIAREPGVIALLGLAGEKAHIVCARSADLTPDMAALLKLALTALGGRGGGQPALAQGGAGAATVDQVRAALDAAAAAL